MSSSNTETIRWSDLRMEDGTRPGVNDTVVVSMGQTLILDQDVEVEGLIIMGDLVVEDTRDSSLATDWALVMENGGFHVGSEEQPFEHKFTLTLAGDDPNFDLDLSPYGMNTTIENNNAFLMAMGDGAKIEIHADDAAKESWTQLNGPVQAGENTLSFTEATGWEVGDKIAIASTDFDLNQAEELTIVAVSNNGRTVTVDKPLEYMHYGEIETYSNGTDSWDLDMRAEVALLSRDVTIQGDEDAAETQYGGHTMVMNGAEMHISGAEFTHMGQAGILGKYAAHWHLIGDASGQYIKNSSFHHTFNKGLTIHGTANTEVSDNVVFESIGHGYFFEDGTETGNVLTGNLGFNTRAPESRDDATIKSDFESPSTYWVENGGNEFYGNHAAGSEHTGFWFEPSRGNEIKEPGIIQDNVTHTNAGRGFFLNHGGLIQDGNPSGSADQPQKVDPWVVEGLTVYKSELGTYVRGVEGTFTDAKIAETGENARFRLNQTIEDSLIVGRTDNIGNPQTPEEIAAGRSLPDDGVFNGFQLYDGPAGLSNVHIDSFYAGDDTAINLSNAVHKSASFFVEGLTFGENMTEAGKLDLTRGANNSVGNDSQGRAIVDIDGSLTGVPGATITQQISLADEADPNLFNAGSNYTLNEDWNAVITQDATMGLLRIDDNVANNGKVVVFSANNQVLTRSDGEVASGFEKQVPVFTDSDYTYALDFNNGPDEFRLYLADTPLGEGVIIEMSAVPEDASFTLDAP